jgi:sugar phosphate isomerase/epimerase
MQRREFLKNAGALAASAFMLPQFSEAKTLKKFGLQLYSLRDVIAQDTQNVLKQIASAGYKELEAYGIDSGKFFGVSGKEFKKMCDDLGMKVVGSHAMPGRLADKDVKNIDEFAPKWKKSVEVALEGGLKYITQPWLEENYRKSADEIKKTAESLNKLGEYAKSQGLEFSYHNHDFEFAELDGQPIYDIMLKNTDAKIVKFEMDLFWVYYAGKDPVAYFNKYPGRFHAFHIKDMSKTEKKVNADVGTGAIDFVSLLKNSGKSGVKYFHVEQETGYNPDSVTSAKNSAAYLKTITF